MIRKATTFTILIECAQFLTYDLYFHICFVYEYVENQGNDVQ